MNTIGTNELFDIKAAECIFIVYLIIKKVQKLNI